MASLVTRSARKATRLCGTNIKAMARKAHRAHRHEVNEALATLADKINNGYPLDEVDINISPSRSHMVTGWDVA